MGATVIKTIKSAIIPAQLGEFTLDLIKGCNILAENPKIVGQLLILIETNTGVTETRSFVLADIDSLVADESVSKLKYVCAVSGKILLERI